MKDIEKHKFIDENVIGVKVKANKILIKFTPCVDGFLLIDEDILALAKHMKKHGVIKKEWW
jgi:hypothetical protein